MSQSYMAMHDGIVTLRAVEVDLSHRVESRRRKRQELAGTGWQGVAFLGKIACFCRIKLARRRRLDYWLGAHQ